jgi:hypothetical protein
MLKRFRKVQEDKLSLEQGDPFDGAESRFRERIAAAVERQEARYRQEEHKYYAGIALKAMIEKWDGDPEKGRFVIAHKAHLIADAMVNADWERREQSDG